MNIESIARTIRRRRRDLGVDQKTLADLAGVSVHTISDVESAKGNPTVETLEAILEPLGLELAVRVRTKLSPESCVHPVRPIWARPGRG